MKKVIKPAEKEEAVYYSDFTGKCFGVYEPETTLSIKFNYGSKYDGETLILHLSDEEAELVLEFIKSNISEDYKKAIKEKLYRQSVDLDDAIDARDYTQADIHANCCEFLKSLLK